MKKEFNTKALDNLKKIAGLANPLRQNLAIAGGASAEDRIELADEYLTILTKSGRITGATFLKWDGLDLTTPEQFRELFSQQKTAIVFEEVGEMTKETPQMLRLICEFMRKKDGPVFILTGTEDKIYGLRNLDPAFDHRITRLICPEKEVTQLEIKRQKPASPG